MKSWETQIKVSRAHLFLIPRRSWRLPPLATVALRGGLGKAMMELACVRRSQVCTGCSRENRCLIPCWYDPGRAGNPAYRPVIVSCLSDNGARITEEIPLQVELIVSGDIPRSSLLLEALFRAAAFGLGPEKIEHRIARMTVSSSAGPVTVIEDGAPIAPWPQSGRLDDLIDAPEQVYGAVVRLLSPVQWRGISPNSKPALKDLLKAAIERVRAVARAQNVQIDRWWPAPQQITGLWQEPRWVRSARYSRRQQAVIDLSGWIGSVRIGPGAAPIRDLLSAAEVFRVGRNTSAGNGRIQVEWNQEEPRFS